MSEITDSTINYVIDFAVGAGVDTEGSDPRGEGEEARL